MKSTGPVRGKATSIPLGMIISALVCIATTICICAIIAYLLQQERITWYQAGYFIMFQLFITSFLGAKVAYCAIKHQRLFVSLMSGFLYWGLLLCMSGLFFGGNFSAIKETAALIFAGSGSAALIHKRKKKIRNTRKGLL